MLRGAAVSQPSTALTDRVSGTGAGSTAASPQGEFKSQTCSEGNRKVTSQVALLALTCSCGQDRGVKHRG